MLTLRKLFGDSGKILTETDFQLLLLAAVVGPLGLSVVSPILESLIGPFGTSAVNIGLMMSFFTAPAIGMTLLAGVLADKYGRKRVLVYSTAVFGLSGTLIAFTTDFGLALGLRALQGIGFGGTTPIIITSVGDIYTGPAEATAQGLRFTVAGLSATAFPLLAGSLVLFAWQYPFLLYAIAIPIAAILHVLLDEPSTNPSDGARDSREPWSYHRELYRLVKRPRVLSLVVARTLPDFVWIGFLTYNSVIVVRLFGGTPPQAGLLVAIGTFTFAITASQAGRITSVLDSRLIPLVGANVCLGGGFILVLLASGFLVALCGIVVVGVGVGITLSLYRSIITGLAPVHLRAGLVSLAEAGSRVTQTVTPVAMGVVISFAAPHVGFEPAVQLAGIGAAVLGGGGGILCLLVATVSRPIEVDDGMPDGNP